MFVFLFLDTLFFIPRFSLVGFLADAPGHVFCREQVGMKCVNAGCMKCVLFSCSMKHISSAALPLLSLLWKDMIIESEVFGQTRPLQASFFSSPTVPQMIFPLACFLRLVHRCIFFFTFHSLITHRLSISSFKFQKKLWNIKLLKIFWCFVVGGMSKVDWICFL